MRLGFVDLIAVFLLIASSVVVATSDDRINHFENKIRPVLLKHCLECHGNDQEDLGGGLSLLSSVTTLAGGDSGIAVNPGKPEESLLLSALRYEGDIDMPPDGRLAASVIADFEHWIRDGAVDPRMEDSKNDARPIAKARDSRQTQDHWAFKPLSTANTVSPLLGQGGVIDAIVDHRLAEVGLQRSSSAKPTTLLRRLHYDLTGLPPSVEMINAFARDPDEFAYQRIVDRLLASDEFGRRWGRHWLDVARYADSNGSDFNATFHHAWRYRDYVIKSFDHDKPFDRFVTEQIAGDLLDTPQDQNQTDSLVATGFLMLGPKMLSERDKAKLQMDVVDDQIDTIGRAFMGLTLGCARCHDHKFDPIPTADYYALAGIFRSTEVLQGEIQKYVSDWIELPLPVDEATREKVASFEREEKQWLAQLKLAEAELNSAKTRLLEGDSSVIVDDSTAKRSGHWVETVYSRPFIGLGYLHDDNRDKGKASVRFETRLPQGKYRISLAYTSGANRSRSTTLIVDDETKKHSFKVDQTKPPTEEPWDAIGELSLDQEQAVTITIMNDGSDGYVIADAVRFSPVNENNERSKLVDLEKIQQDDSNQLSKAVERAQTKVDETKQTLNSLRSNKPEPLPMAMAVRDSKKIEDAFVCVRGEVNLRGETVARGFLRVCPPNSNDSTSQESGGVSMPTDQSGRLQLAQWICDPDHPLTVRVIVNRVWMQLIGEGLVRTVDNFGVLGERPSHPELLDHLAITFLRDGWSVKKLIRSIVTSETYRQSTDFNANAMTVDAENRLLWRMHRKRLPAESLRDTLLVAGNLLDSTPSIAPVSQFGTLVSQNVATPEVVAMKQSDRRGVFLPVIRGQVNELFASFDFADPDLLVGRRERTNVPSQSLVLMNGLEIQRYGQAISREILQTANTNVQVIDAAYLKLYARFPTEEEMHWMTEFLPSLEDGLVRDLIGAMIASSEFRLLD